MKKLKVTKMTLVTKDGKEVELSMDEAKELHEQLHELFGNKTTYIPSTPIVIERERPYWQSPWVTWCNGSITSSSTSGLTTTYSY